MFHGRTPVLSTPSQAPSYELKWQNSFSSDNETVLDWLTMQFEQFGNIAAFVDQISPTVTLSPPTGLNSPVVDSHGLQDPNRFTSTSPSGETTPASIQRTLSPTALVEGKVVHHPHRSYQLRDLWGAFRVPYAVQVHFETPVFLSPMKGPDHSVYYTPQLSGFHFTVHPESANPPADDTTEFSWFAMDKPDARKPFYDQMQFVTSLPEYQYLDNAFHTDFTVGSWFAVLWLPVHIKNHTQTHSAGSFLCFYFINPALSLGGSQYRGTECYFRTDALAVQRPVWLLDKHVQPSDDITAIGSVQEVSRVGTPATAAVTSSPAVAQQAFPGAPVGSTATSHRDSPMPGGALSAIAASSARTAPEAIRIPIFAMVPSRFRTDVWFRQLESSHRRHNFVGPLFLIAAAFQLLQHEASTNPAWSEEHRLLDEHFMTRHERTMMEFKAIYCGM
jgi:hypothetical protein